MCEVKDSQATTGMRICSACKDLEERTFDIDCREFVPNCLAAGPVGHAFFGQLFLDFANT